MEKISNEEKAKHLASREMYGGFTLAEKNAAYQSAMQMAKWKDEQYLSAKFITKVLRMAEKFSDRRILPAVAAQIAHELRAEIA